MERMAEKNMLNQTENMPMSKKDPQSEKEYNEIAEEEHDRNGSADKYKCYQYEDYEKDVLAKGLRRTWEDIISFIVNNGNENRFLDIGHLSELYEIGLALQNKHSKKATGQYYTPKDVARVMATWLEKGRGANVCDVACGTGNLILAYLDLIGKDEAVALICNGCLYLYDSDDVALRICEAILLLKYGKELKPFIHFIQGDFLSKQVRLPENCKVISNPPYATVNSINGDWEDTAVALQTKELYSMFMEKIIQQSVSSVIITPYSFIGGSKYYSLRKIMNNYNGFIVVFDNVPGNIFRGKKYGVFNTNTSNSVRAAITVVENKAGRNGFKTTPLIRFKNEERTRLLQIDVLENFVNDQYQIISEKHSMYYKCAKDLNGIWSAWKGKSQKYLRDYIKKDGRYVLAVPNTCRYYTTASNGALKRNGQIVLNIDDKDIFNYVYCLMNSSFAYWYWRLFDGGITYPRGLLLSMPVFYDILTEDDKIFFGNISGEMIGKSDCYIVTKKNVGLQENIKYPRVFRDKINRRFLDILGIDTDEKVFDIVHSNTALEENV